MKNWNEFRDGPWEGDDDILVPKIQIGWSDYLVWAFLIAMYGLTIGFLLTH